MAIPRIPKQIEEMSQEEYETMMEGLAKIPQLLKNLILVSIAVDKQVLQLRIAGSVEGTYLYPGTLVEAINYLSTHYPDIEAEAIKLVSDNFTSTSTSTSTSTKE
jgi:hypothetical protein